MPLSTNGKGALAHAQRCTCGHHHDKRGRHDPTRPPADLGGPQSHGHHGQHVVPAQQRVQQTGKQSAVRRRGRSDARMRPTRPRAHRDSSPQEPTASDETGSCSILPVVLLLHHAGHASDGRALSGVSQGHARSLRRLQEGGAIPVRTRWPLVREPRDGGKREGKWGVTVLLGSPQEP